MSGTHARFLLGFILGGMMSIDMGGPFNKAAYVFGTASIAAGNYEHYGSSYGRWNGCLHVRLHLQHYLFKNKFTKEETYSQDLQTLLWDLSFITEGAIPLCSIRSITCTSGLYRRLRYLQEHYHMVFGLYTDGTSWWNLRIPCCGQCNYYI